MVQSQVTLVACHTPVAASSYPEAVLNTRKTSRDRIRPLQTCEPCRVRGVTACRIAFIHVFNTIHRFGEDESYPYLSDSSIWIISLCPFCFTQACGRPSSGVPQ